MALFLPAGSVARNHRLCLSRGSARGKIDCRGIAAAEHDADALARSRPIAAGRERGESGGAARLGDDPGHAPQYLLRPDDGVVAYQDHAIDVALRDRKTP